MSDQPPVLHMLCGKIAAGKSTLAAELSSAPKTIRINEDDWLATLFADQMETPRDFMRCSTRLRAAMGPHIVALLRAGLSVVLDFQANTVDARAWMRGLSSEAGADHRLHLLTASDAICLARLKARNAGGDHPFAATEAQFHQVTKFFQPPSEDEGLTVIRHDPAV
ncbi:AAA family ATPase [Dinoroseobacter sp. S124A]|uniref:AAA family ATPase n=1 Tax=Dinoroseobacter sp. S124A TaxID=3415128 RepID=UPI003C79A9FA